ncbi:DUF429 domain-containing protein [uncultured Deinococcus sp.]|uniref:DUF429 domain-containing protein n=1 Tax=uncultured Deinococcus sp. TaxID=158789 RepID=UPI0037495221
MRFIGLDLAWAAHNPTGAAVLDERGEVLDTALLGGDEDVLAYVAAQAGQGAAIIGVDAPLTVPNLTGRRPAEAELGRVFARFQAGAHPANRRHLEEADGTIRGERLVEGLAALGFVHDPHLEVGAQVRRVLEVYPHPAMVSLFGLGRTLKYKNKGQGRPALEAGWAALRSHLLALEAARPPLRGVAGLMPPTLDGLRGRGLKNLEDQVDAVVCAYVALYAWTWGAARTEVFGSLEEGYILTPTLPERWKEG